MKTDEELKKIAKDLIKEKIFTDRHCQDPEDIRKVFMLLSLMNKEQLQDFQDKKPAFIFEYLDKANPRAINGMPSFFSMQYLNEEETEKMISYYNLYKTALDEV